ncbi:hypothetical protein Tco_0247508 [Tanacetum coccineum]
MHQAKQPRIWLHGIGERNLLVEAQDAGQILDVSNSYFLQIQEFQQIKLRQSSLTMLLFQELGSRTLYDSDCDDLLTAQSILMANISNYGSDIISEVPNSENYLNDMDNQSVLALQDFEIIRFGIRSDLSQHNLVIAISFHILNICKKHNMQLFKILIYRHNKIQ